MNEGNGGRGLLKRRTLSDQSSHQAFTWRLLLSPIEPSQSYLKQLDLTRPVSIVGYRELHNHTFQTSWDAMVWYFYDQFYSSRACYQGGPGPRKSRTDPDQIPAVGSPRSSNRSPGSGSRSLPGLNMPRIPGSGRTAPHCCESCPRLRLTRVKQSDWALEAAGRDCRAEPGSNWSLASELPESSSVQEASSESEEWQQTRCHETWGWSAVCAGN